MDYIIIALISLVCGGAGYILIGQFRYLISKKKLNSVLAFEIAAQSVLDQAIQLPMIDRALILKAHNGGKMEFAYSFRYISVLYEGASQTTSVIKNAYQSYPMDKAYKLFINKLITDKQVFYQTRTEDVGMLQRAYNHDEIETANMYILALTKDAVYFCSFSSKLKPGGFLNSPDYVIMEQLANKLMQLHRTAKKANLFE